MVKRRPRPNGSPLFKIPVDQHVTQHCGSRGDSRHIVDRLCVVSQQDQVPVGQSDNIVESWPSRKEDPSWSTFVNLVDRYLMNDVTGQVDFAEIIHLPGLTFERRSKH